MHGIFDTSTHSMDVAERQHATYNSTKLVRYADLPSACEDPVLDGIMICTPNHTHFEVLQVAMGSGLPIFLEKPMTATLEDAARIIELAASYESFIQLGLQYRYKAQYREALWEALARKSLGSVKTISMSEYRPPFLDKVGQWNKFNATSGGTLLEKCCHYFDLINQLAQARPVRVFASGGQAVNFLELEIAGEISDIDDYAFVVIEYGNAIRANFTLNMFSPDFHEELIVVGKHARLVASERVSIQQQDASKITLAIELGEQSASRQIELAYPQAIERSGHHGSTYYEHIAFMQRLGGVESDAATVSDGFWSMVIATAAQHSMQTGAPVSIEDLLNKEGLTGLMKE